MISHENRAIFVHIQKTAGSSINAALGWDENPPEKHFRADQLKQLYGDHAWATYYKFAFVRNPWDRLVSWWEMIDGLRPGFESGQPVNAFTRYVLTRAKTFEEFLLEATAEINDPDGEKSTTRNQIDYLVDIDGAVIVDFVGRFETLHSDFAIISDTIFGVQRSLAHVNASIRSDYRSYYTPDLAALVASRFSRDIEQFGYSFDPPSERAYQR